MHACRVGAGEEGQRFVRLLAAATGARVAASSELVGHPGLHQLGEHGRVHQQLGPNGSSPTGDAIRETVDTGRSGLGTVFVFNAGSARELVGGFRDNTTLTMALARGGGG